MFVPMICATPAALLQKLDILSPIELTEAYSVGQLVQSPRRAPRRVAPGPLGDHYEADYDEADEVRPEAVRRPSSAAARQRGGLDGGLDGWC